MSQFLEATEIFVRWLEAECGPNVREGFAAVIAAERGDVGNQIIKKLAKTRHYHLESSPDLHDSEVLTANRVIGVVQAECGLERVKT